MSGGQRERRRLLEKLARSGSPLPRWIGTIGDVTPCRAALLTDSWGDERSVWIDFERADGEVRGLGVSVNGSQGAYGCHFVYGPPIEAIEGPFAKQPHTVMRPLGLADARAMVEAALERRDHTDLAYDGDDGLDHELRALVDQLGVRQARSGQGVGLAGTGGSSSGQRQLPDRPPTLDARPRVGPLPLR